jgi:hypothetical protein
MEETRDQLHVERHGFPRMLSDADAKHMRNTGILFAMAKLN